MQERDEKTFARKLVALPLVVLLFLLLYPNRVKRREQVFAGIALAQRSHLSAKPSALVREPPIGVNSLLPAFLLTWPLVRRQKALIRRRRRKANVLFLDRSHSLEVLLEHQVAVLE